MTLTLPNEAEERESKIQAMTNTKRIVIYHVCTLIGFLASFGALILYLSGKKSEAAFVIVAALVLAHAQMLLVRHLVDAGSRMQPYNVTYPPVSPQGK